jgi:hypothetical protein
VAFGIYPAAADRNANTAFSPPKANEFEKRPFYFLTAGVIRNHIQITGHVKHLSLKGCAPAIVTKGPEYFGRDRCPYEHIGSRLEAEIKNGVSIRIAGNDDAESSTAAYRDARPRLEMGLCATGTLEEVTRFCRTRPVMGRFRPVVPRAPWAPLSRNPE